MHSLARHLPHLLPKGALLMPLLSPAAPARAGHWVLTNTCSGRATPDGNVTQSYTAPTGTTDNSVSIPQVSVGQGAEPTFGPGPYPPIATDAKLMVTVKGTWTADGKTDDTPPPGVLLSVSTVAQASGQSNGGASQPGSADDGYGDPVAQSGSSLGTSAPSPSPKFVSESGSSFTVSLSLSASFSATLGPNGGSGSAASVGPITISVHAQPYNFHKTSGIDEGDGTLLFTYGWSSSDGNISDLTSCFMHERVTYPGGNPYPVPLPFSWSNPLPNPTISPGQGQSGIAMTSITDNEDHQYVWTPVAPYSNSTITAQQQYEYDDIATGAYNTVIPGPDATASIVRTIGSRQLQLGWWYSCTKQGLTAWLQLH